MTTSDLLPIANYGWSGAMYVGIPASGYTTIPGMLARVSDLSFDDGGLKQLPTLDGKTFGANYFLTRGEPYHIATDSLSEPWSAAPRHCSRWEGCYSPPMQYCKDLECGPRSYPMYGNRCVSAADVLSEVQPPGKWTYYPN